MEERLLKILSELRPEVDFTSETALVDDGILDSFDMVALVTEINDEFDVRIGIENLVPENFNSVDSIKKSKDAVCIDILTKGKLIYSRERV